MKLGEARLAIARGDLGMALALLDLYAGYGADPPGFCSEARSCAPAFSTKSRIPGPKPASEAKGSYNDQHFASALQTASNGLKLDNEDPTFLFQAGINACVAAPLRGRGFPLLHRYLDLTDSHAGQPGTAAERHARSAAWRLPAANSRSAGAPAKAATSWFSGGALGGGVFYDPVSMAFQPKVTHVNASNHLTVQYEWTGNQLRSVHTKYEEKKTGSNIAKLALAGAAASQGVSLPVNLRTTGRETNDFYFNYYDDVPQIFKRSSRDNALWSRAGRFPHHASPPAWRRVRYVPGGEFRGDGLDRQPGPARRHDGRRRVEGNGRFGRDGRSVRYGWNARPGGGGQLEGTRRIRRNGRLRRNGRDAADDGVAQLLRSCGPPRRITPTGFSRYGTARAWVPRASGLYRRLAKRVAVGFSGNRYFHPLCLGRHSHLPNWITDDQGRVRHAWELDEPNAPRLDFTWEGKRLMSVIAKTEFTKRRSTRGTLSYSGDKAHQRGDHARSGKASHIRYKYSKQGVLLEADCDADLSLDGRSRKAEFVDETADKGRR